MADILLALVPSLILGVMTLLLIGLGGNDRQKIMGLFIGAFTLSALATPFLGPHWTPTTLVVAYISGLMLGWGLYDQTVSLGVLGVSRAMPISTGTQLALMSLGGVVLFGEWHTTGAMSAGIAAVICLVAGVWAVSRTEKVPGSQRPAVDWPRGARLIATSTCTLVGYLLLVRWFGIESKDVLLPQAAGYLSAGLLLTWPRSHAERGMRWGKATIRQIGTGMLWACAVLLLQITMVRVGVAVGFTLSQLGVIISTIGGIVLFGEQRTRKELWWTAIGVTLVVLGAILSGVARSLDT
ncbi:MAG: GRP family sugar transporter [Actinomycetaceae bacterium]|nr:GRP family sugar transporter [Actinomycetaceae bacterium]